MFTPYNPIPCQQPGSTIESGCSHTVYSDLICDPYTLWDTQSFTELKQLLLTISLININHGHLIIFTGPSPTMTLLNQWCRHWCEHCCTIGVDSCHYCIVPLVSKLLYHWCWHYCTIGADIVVPLVLSADTILPLVLTLLYHWCRYYCSIGVDTIVPLVLTLVYHWCWNSCTIDAYIVVPLVLWWLHSCSIGVDTIVSLVLTLL